MLTRPRLILAVLCLAACRAAIAPVNVEPGVTPDTGRGVQACWVESRGRLGFTASAILVRHPQGDVLVDAGNSTDFAAEIAAYPPKRRRWLAMFPGALKPRAPLAGLLAAVGADPTALRWVVPTHAHLDHLGGVLDLPPTPVLMSPSEIDLVGRAMRDDNPDVVPAHARFVTPHLVPIVFAGSAYEIFDRHADLFGDGSVVVVPLPGHTPGSVGVFVRRPDGSRVFHLGDAVNSRDQIAALRGRTPAMRATDVDRGAAETIVARLHAFAKTAKGVVFLPAHERAAWVDAFGAPATRCAAPGA